MRLSPDAEQLRAMLAVHIRNLTDPVIDLNDLQDMAAQLSPIIAPGLREEEVSDVINALMEQYRVVMGDGYGVVNRATYEPWIESRRPEATLPRSTAYSELLLDRGWSGAVVDTLDAQTDRILDLTGDPLKTGSWARRGIAIGEVQSGKTATYISLLAKAIDYGFKIIIVIGGHTEDLRRQTQTRLDSDLTGIDSAYLEDNISRHDIARVGIGNINKRLPTTINVLTTTQSDFSAASKRAGKVALGAGTPTLFVVKKNHRVLQNLAQYLSVLPADGDQPPLLLIDDEADWASINTNSEEEVTAVNAAIRKLLACSNRNSYVGITATPFANIFINDEVEEDLFPRDFVQVLESPSNYRGVGEYFTSATHPSLMEQVSDTLAAIPYSHRASVRVRELPQSIRKAIAAFYIGTAIRRHRDGEARPASMLINVSRFKAVQARIHALVEAYIDELSAMIMGEFALEDSGRRSEAAEFLAETYAEVFPDVDVSWASVRRELVDIAESMRTQLINGDTKTARDRWLAQTSRPMRDADALVPTIYVGGDVLARGLTLDGLQVSYYARRAAAADTLLQMGRWFGYRPGYEDLVRLWIDPETSELFRWTADLSQRLRDSLAEMNAKGLTPKDFGLRMQRHPEGFQIANAKKMQHAEDFVGVISLNSSVWESHMLNGSMESRARNLESMKALIARLGLTEASEEGANLVWRGVPADEILAFLQSFRAHEVNHPFGAGQGEQPPIVTGFADIKNVDSWDVALISGRGRPLGTPGMPSIQTSVRDGAGLDSGILRFPNRRVAAGADLASLVPRERRAALEEEAGRKLADRALARKALESPTLMLYLVTAKDGSDTTSPDRWEGVVASATDPIPAIVVATPQLTADEEYEEIMSEKGVRWKINRVLARQLMGWSDDSDDEEDDER